MNLRTGTSATCLNGLAAILLMVLLSGTANSEETHPSSGAPTLESQLKERRDGFAKGAPAEVRSIMKEKAEELARSGIVEKSLGIGSKAPDFKLPNATGDKVRLRDMLQEGPVVLTFYRGGWCPYCNLQLQAMQRILPDIKKHGGRLVAVSPELPDKSLSTQEKNELGFDVLSDQGNRVARQFRIVFTLADEIRPIYKQFRINLPAQNGDESFQLPLPATYVIDRDGTIRYAYVNTDYTRRAEPAEVVKALQHLPN